MIVVGCAGNGGETVRCLVTDQECIDDARLGGTEVIIVDASGNPVDPDDARILHTQDIWFFADVRLADEAMDLMSEILGLARDSLGPTVELKGDLVFRESHSLRGSVIDATGRPHSHIGIKYALLDHGGETTLIAFTSADLEQGFSNVGRNDVLTLEIPGLTGSTDNMRVEIDFAFAQALPPEDASQETGLTDAEVLARRWNAGDVLLYGGREESNGSPALFVFTDAAGRMLRSPDDERVVPINRRGPSLLDRLRPELVKPLFAQRSSRPRPGGGFIIAWNGKAEAANYVPAIALGVASGGACFAVFKHPLCFLVGVGMFGAGGAMTDLHAGEKLRARNWPEPNDECAPASFPPPDTGGPPGGGPPGDPPPAREGPRQPLGPPTSLNHPDSRGGELFTLVRSDATDTHSANADAISGSGTRSPRPEATEGLSEGSCGGGSGDPHMTTFDRRRYDLQAAGEFVAVTDGTGNSDIQVRMEPAGPNVSVATALAMEVAGSRVTVTAGAERPILVDGRPPGLRTALLEPLPNGGHISRYKDRVGVYWPDGTVLRARIRRHLNFTVYVPPDRAGDLRGLLGDFDGRPDNDFRTRQGELLPAPPGFEVLYGRFAESWRVAAEESLFDYAEGESTATFTDPEFPSAAVGIENLSGEARDRAERVCRDAGVTEPYALEACVIDVASTNDHSFALSAQASQRLYDAVDGAATGTGWSLELRGQLAEIRGSEIATGEGLALVRTTTERATTLHAIDIESGKVRWSTPDVDPHCRPVVVEGLGVAAQLGRGTSSAGNGVPIVLFSLDDGKELARSPGEIPGNGCQLSLSASGATVIQPTRMALYAFDAAKGMAPKWKLEIGDILHQWVPALDDHLIVFSRQLPATLAIRSLDPDTGEEVDALQVAGGAQFNLSVLDDHSVAAIAGNAGDEPKATTVVEVVRGKLTETWSRDFAEETELRQPLQLALVGDVVVGWTKHASGNGLVGFDAETGDIVWTHRATSFDNSRGMVETVGQSVVAITPFGGAWVELVSSSGETTGTLDPPTPEYRRAPDQLTALPDGWYIATGVIEKQGGVYVLILGK